MEKQKTLEALVDGLAGYGSATVILRMVRDGYFEHTYQQLADRVGRLCGGLLKGGVSPGQRVGLFSEPRFEAIAAALAVIRAGAVIVLLDIQFSDKTLSTVLEDSETRILFTTSGHLERLRKVAPKATIIVLDREKNIESNGRDKAQKNLGWLDWMSDAPQRPPSLHAEDPVCLFYTSGTTGPPKGVPLTHRNILFQLETVRSQNLITKQDRVLLPLPLHHVYPFVIGVLVPLFLGVCIVVPGSLTGPQIIRAVRQGRTTVIIGVPRLYDALLTGIKAKSAGSGFPADLLFAALLSASTAVRRRWGVRVGKRLFRALHERIGRDLRILTSGGSPLAPELAWRLEGMGWQVAIGYGLTEMSPLLTINLPGKARIGSVGRAVNGVELRISPETVMEKEKTGRKDAGTGEIQAKGPGIFEGYLNLEEKTREVFTEDGWFRTGDLGYVDHDGYVYVSGRASTLIVTQGGENIQPDQVEEAYEEHPIIREAGVLERNGRLVAVIVPEAGEAHKRGGNMEELIRKAVSERSAGMPSYQRISDFAITRELLPRTRLGKIRRHLLSERFDQAKQEAEQPERKAGPISIEEMSDQDRALMENRAARSAWDWLAERYRTRRITPDTSPRLDLGVDSMEWLNLTMEIRETVGVELRDAAIGRIETVRDLLHEIVEASGQGGEPAAKKSLEHPEEALTWKQKQWLTPLGPVATMLFNTLYGLNRALVHALFRLEVHGLDRLPRDQQVVFTPNHVSYLDPFVLGAALPLERLQRSYWAGWTGAAFHNPVNTLISRLAKTIPIDPKKGIFSSLALGAAVLDGGDSLVPK